MAEKIKENQFDAVGVNPFNAPVPGESLTSSPDMPRAWERPPQYTSQDNAMEAIYMEITSEDSLRKLINIINDGVALDEIAQVILYKGYTEGKFSPDLMLLLIEPTIYLLIAIADYADIKDYVLYEGEEDDPEGQIYDDDETPIEIGDDDEEENIADQEYTKPMEDALPASLLAKVKKELPEKLAKENK